MSKLPPPYYNDDTKSFAFATVRKRWPLIVEGMISDLNEEIKNKPDLEEGAKQIERQLRDILAAFKSDEEILPFDSACVAAEPELKHYNEALAEFNSEKKVTWLTGPWLFLECYLYRLVRIIFLNSSSRYFKKFDIFERLKNNTFKQSEAGVFELCKRYQVLSEQLHQKTVDEEALNLLFKEFVDISLWGNATDLSLLAGNVTLEDIQSVQGAEVRKKNEEKIIVNDIPEVWKKLQSSKKEKRRFDIVLDNSGFELFADLVFCLFALDTEIAHEAHFHCKDLPWFVSDTMPKDFDNLLSQLVDPQFFVNLHKDQDHSKLMHVFQSKLKEYVASGQIIVESHPFWTRECNYWYISKEKDLYENLLGSDLIIFKGDLNYRKLTGDLNWDKTTPFKTSIQDLAHSKLPVLSLRTCKADVVVGLAEGVNEKIIEQSRNMGNEQPEMWSSSGKYAVISFSSGI